MAISTFTSKIVRKEYLTDDVILFSLERPEEFSFKSGQYVFFNITKEGETKARAYSILNSENEKGHLNFIIKLIPGGFASETFRTTKVGDAFEIKGPLGHLTFAEDSPNTEHWLIGVGCGLAPLYSMVKKYLTIYPEKKFVLLFSEKKKENLLFYEELKELEKNNSNFVFMPTLTREEWEGLTGRVQTHFPEDLKNKTFYICGLKELVLDTKELLLSKGVNPQDVKFERYS